MRRHPPRCGTCGLQYRQAGSFSRSWRAIMDVERAKKPHERAKSTRQVASEAEISVLGTNQGRSTGPEPYRPPRETRSISVLTIRSTSPGKLSSSQDFSIGRNISLTRSSSVRALLLSTVWARLLKADSTADTVERDKICGAAGAARLSTGGGTNAGCRGAGLAAASVNSRSSVGSTFLNEGGGGSGSAISSVSSNTSPSGRGWRISSAVVASSSPFSRESMSSWLFDAAGAGAGAGGAGGGGAFAGAARAAGIADGGMSFITGGFAGGAAAAGLSGLAGAAGVGGGSAVAG